MSHPLHPKHTGRDECDAVSINTCSRKSCSNCHETITSSKLPFQCLPCDFKLCHKCYNGFRHPAHVEHFLFLVNVLQLCGNAVKCMACNKSSDTTCYHCGTCNFNLCKNCFKNLDSPLHEHRLICTDVRYAYGVSNGEWCCDCCGGNNGRGNYIPRHCISCSFDLCNDCTRPWSSPFHQHELFKADSLSIYKQYSGGWECDNCKESFTPRKNRYPYHCSLCEYDLCKRCLKGRDNEGIDFPRRAGGNREISAFRNLMSQRSVTRTDQRSMTRTAAGNPVTSPEEDMKNEIAKPVPLADSSPCVVCLSNPKDATIVHGTTGHVCCCMGCANELQRRGASCPMCRAPIDLVIQQFMS